MRLGVVIPTYNEAEFIGPTIESLGQQVDRHGERYEPERLEVVVADTPGHDGTPDAAREAGARTHLKVTIVSEPEPSMVAARIAGLDHLLSRPEGPPDVLISADADTRFPVGWLGHVEGVIRQGYGMVSTSGCFEHEFWMRCRRLARRYVEEIGIVFFNNSTAEAVLNANDRPLFTPRLFEQFGRPVSDCGLAITTELYQSIGGIRREHYDDDGQREILAVGWPLMFRVELAGHSIGQMRWPEYETSARRLLHEPEALFSGASYLNEIEHFRCTSGDQYAWIDHFAERLDMAPLRRYVIKNYILQQCITRPDRITANRSVFGEATFDVLSAVAAWHSRHPSPRTRDVFEFADKLADDYGSVVLARLRQEAGVVTDGSD